MRRERTCMSVSHSTCILHSWAQLTNKVCSVNQHCVHIKFDKNCYAGSKIANILNNKFTFLCMTLIFKYLMQVIFGIREDRLYKKEFKKFVIEFLEFWVLVKLF